MIDGGLDLRFINFQATDSHVIELIYKLLQAHPFVNILFDGLFFSRFVEASEDLEHDGSTDEAPRKCDTKPEEHQYVLLRQPIAGIIAEQFLVPGVFFIVRDHIMR